MRRASLLLILLIGLGGCATEYAPPGPGPADPALRGDGVYLANDGLELPYRQWLPEQAPPKAVVLALHGFNDYSKAFAELGTALRAQGIAVVAYDQRGFGAGPNPGLWPGTGRMAQDALVAAKLLQARYPDAPLFLLGESMGGAVSSVMLARYTELEVAGHVLIAPAVWGRQTQPWYQEAALWVALQLFPGWTPTGEGLGRQASDNIEMLRALGRDPLFIKETRIDAVDGLVNLMDEALASAPALDQPTLLLYGAKEEIVPPEPILTFWGNLPSGPADHRFAYYEDGWHMLTRDLQGGVVIEDIAAWVLAGARPLPSGADEAGAAFLADQASEEMVSDDKIGESQ